jgi:hypothetical protein
VSVLEQTGPPCSARVISSPMSITKHIPDNLPGPTGSAFLGYPLGIWPQAHSPFCADRSPSNTRHSDCSVPGCICLCHASPYGAGGVERLRVRKEAKVKAIDEKSLETIDTLEWMDRLGTNRDSTRVSFRK